MLYAKVVLGLPIDGPFDYLVPADWEEKLNPGSRVRVNFRNKKEVAYVVELNNKTKIKKIKEIISAIDHFPILDEPMLLLTKRLAQYYCCSWGEAIDAALPDELRKGKTIKEEQVSSGDKTSGTGKPPLEDQLPLFVQGIDRMPVYLKETKKVLAAKRSAIILCSNIAAVERVKSIVEDSLGIETYIAFRKQPRELESWGKIRQIDHCVVVGLRSSIFSPVNNLGLIIIDQPEDQVYKQEQVPHYHAREVAFMRGQIQGAKVILGSHSLSLESFYLLQKEKMELENIPSKSAYPLIKVIDLRRLAYAERKNKPMFSKFLLDAIQAVLAEKGNVLLVVNRKGFATMVSCHNCGKSLKCPRCNINLVFHFDEDRLKCHHCNFKMPVPKICPHCNAGYIKYFGAGVEKVESELARIFPLARLGQDIVVSTGAVTNQRGANFDLIGILGIDDLLNRVDFRAAEKVFSMLTGIINLTSKKVIIQSGNSNHHCFQALIKNNPQLFLKEEFKNRKQLNFAPFRHMILLKIRGMDQEKVKAAAQDLFQRLNKIRTSSLKLLWLNPGQPPKLRGNFYYQILMRALSVEKAGHFLKLHLKAGHSSGIIVTVDVDPV
ncbi:MAG: primosomal protein N' [Candidatus Omnitrophica bacterium CG11_big_fil_rev_8_21_14_0_20_43_6]|nr:MAG: primosomal protein N' [Candidatus Omnitrophica bacterium CG11_big_fil_rev_8_21_14_0_20_43_6]